MNALTIVSTPQTLKSTSYLKHCKVITLINSERTHNFIHRHVTQETHFYIHVVNNFQIMIANGGAKKCGVHCEKYLWLQMGDNSLKIHMFSIDMGGCDIILGVE